MATVWWPGDESTLIVSVWRPVDLNVRLKTTARGTNDAFHRFTRATARPSISTTARPRVGPSGPTHFTDVPVNVNVAVAPGSLDQATRPPM